MEDEIRPVLDKRGGRPKVAHHYFEVLCKQAGIQINERTDSHYNDAYDIGVESLYVFGQIVAGFVPSAAAANRAVLKVPPTCNGKFGWYDEKLAGSTLSNAEKLVQDKAILAELFPDLDFQARNNQKRTFVPDQLALGLAHLVDRAEGGLGNRDDLSRIPLWYAWALRIYLDVLLRLGKDCSKAFNQMQDEIYHMKRSVRGISASPGLPGFNKFLESLVEWDQDGMRECRAREVAIGLHNRTSLPPDPPYRFLRHNPMYCGLWLLTLRTNFHRLGIHYAAPPAGIMHVAQLYHALREEKLLPEELKWLDLETFRQMQGDSAFFVGEPPTTIDGHYKNYALCIGNSITNWAKNKRTGKGGKSANNRLVATNNPNRRNMNMLASLSFMMRNRIVQPNVTGPVSAEVIETILEKGREFAARDGKGFLRADKKDDGKKATALVLYETTPANVLRQLALDMEAEAPNLKFDYFMHNTCWDLLLRLKKRFSELLNADMSQYLLPTEEHLTFLVGYIFITASGHSAKLTVKLPPGSENRALLDAAAAETVKCLEEGNTTTKILDAEKKDLSGEEKKDLDRVFSKYKVNNGPSYEEVMREMGRLGVRSGMDDDDDDDDEDDDSSDYFEDGDDEVDLRQALGGALGGIFGQILRERGIDPNTFGR